MEDVGRTIRFPRDVYEALSEWAKDEERSLQQQVIYLLRRAVAERKTQEGQGDERR